MDLVDGLVHKLRGIMLLISSLGMDHWVIQEVSNSASSGCGTGYVCCSGLGKQGHVCPYEACAALQTHLQRVHKKITVCMHGVFEGVDLVLGILRPLVLMGSSLLLLKYRMKPPTCSVFVSLYHGYSLDFMNYY